MVSLIQMLKMITNGRMMPVLADSSKPVQFILISINKHIGKIFEGAQELEFNTDPPNAKGPNKSYVITGLKNLMGPPDYEVIELGVL